MANVEFGTGKTVLILTIVAACFAVLWPKIFYPMLISSPSAKTPGDNLNGKFITTKGSEYSKDEILHDLYKLS